MVRVADAAGSGFRLDFALQGAHGAPPQALCRIEHAPVVERAAATQRALRYCNGEPETFQDQSCGNRSLRTEIIVERVGPEHHPRSAARLRSSPPEPTDEGFFGVARDIALLGDTARFAGKPGDDIADYFEPLFRPLAVVVECIIQCFGYFLLEVANLD